MVGKCALHHSEAIYLKSKKRSAKQRIARTALYLDGKSGLPALKNVELELGPDCESLKKQIQKIQSVTLMTTLSERHAIHFLVLWTADGHPGAIMGLVLRFARLKDLHLPQKLGQDLVPSQQLCITGHLVLDPEKNLKPVIQNPALWMGDGRRGQVGAHVLRSVHMELLLPHNPGRERVPNHNQNMKEKTVPEIVRKIETVMQDRVQLMELGLLGV